MIVKGKARAEFMQGPQGREVLWLGASEPPASLVTFLGSRGLALVTEEALTSATPLRLLHIEPTNSALTRTPQLTGRRLAVMHLDPGCADALAQALRAKGAEVVVLSLNPASLERAETLDPDAVIMEASDFSGSSWDIVRALHRHPQLRFATIILATPEMLGSQPATALDVQHLCMAVNDITQTYERVREDAKKRDRFTFALDDMGPSRCLRALLESGRSLRVLFTCADTNIEIDLAEHIIVGAQSPAGAAPDAGLLGVHALNLLLAQCSARVDVRSVDHPAHTNVMAPLEAALHMARDLCSAVRANSVRPAGPQPATNSGEARGNARAAATRNRTLIGVPAVQVDPALVGTKTKPDSAVPPRVVPEAAAEVELEAEAKPRAKPSMPPRPQVAAIPAPATKRTMPPPRPPREGAAVVKVRPDSGPTEPPRVRMSVPPALPASKAPPPPISPTHGSVALDVAIEAVAPAPTPESSPAVSHQSALETLKLPTYTPDTDAELVRAFRGRRVHAPARRTRWIVAGACTFAVVGWLLVRGGGEPTSALPPPAAAAPALAPHARAAAPRPQAPAVVTPTAPKPAPVPAAAAADTPLEEVQQGSHSRESARRAGLLCNQGNLLRGKKMLPSARVKYLEALRAYPNYPRALAGLAQIALSTGGSAEAVSYAKRLVTARPGQAPYHLLLGDAHRAAHEEKQARAAYQTARRLGSKMAKERLAE